MESFASVRTLIGVVVVAVAAAACSSPVITADAPATTAQAAEATTAAPTVAPTTAAPATSVAETTIAPTTAAPETTVPPTTVANDVPAAVESVATLLDEGAEPRQELRFDYTDGATYALDTEVTQSITQSFNGAPAPAGPEVSTTTGVSGVVRVADGLFVLESTTDVAVGSVAGDPALSAQVQAGLDPLIGLLERRTVDSSGVVYDFSLENGEGIDPTALEPARAAGVNGVALAFPPEAIGVGGTWETVAELSISGLPVTQTSTYEVLSIEGSIIELAITTSQAVPVGSAMDIPGADATVQSWSSEGAGTMTVDLTTPALTSVVDAVSSQELRVSAAGEEVDLVQDIVIRTVTSPR